MFDGVELVAHAILVATDAAKARQLLAFALKAKLSLRCLNLGRARLVPFDDRGLSMKGGHYAYACSVVSFRGKLQRR